MTVVLTVLAVLVVGAITGLLVWFASTRPVALAAQAMSEPERAAAHVPLGDAVRPHDVDDLRFDQALRGYRMSEVDATLDRLRDELADREARIEQLQVELDAARAHRPVDPQLGGGPVVRPSAEGSLWSTGEHQRLQAPDRPAADGLD